MVDATGLVARLEALERRPVDLAPSSAADTTSRSEALLVRLEARVAALEASAVPSPPRPSSTLEEVKGPAVDSPTALGSTAATLPPVVPPLDVGDVGEPRVWVLGAAAQEWPTLVADAADGQDEVGQGEEDASAAASLRRQLSACEARVEELREELSKCSAARERERAAAWKLHAEQKRVIERREAEADALLAELLVLDGGRDRDGGGAGGAHTKRGSCPAGVA